MNDAIIGIIQITLLYAARIFINIIGYCAALSLINLVTKGRFIRDIIQPSATFAQSDPRLTTRKVKPSTHNYPCPNCGEMLGLNVNKKWTNFCPHCGQALDWSESDA